MVRGDFVLNIGSDKEGCISSDNTLDTMVGSDLLSGYWQVEKDREKKAFCTFESDFVND